MTRQTLLLILLKSAGPRLQYLTRLTAQSHRIYLGLHAASCTSSAFLSIPGDQSNLFGVCLALHVPFKALFVRGTTSKKMSDLV